MKKYYRITNHLDKAPDQQSTRVSEHIVKANNEEDALRIFNQHNVKPIPSHVELIKQTVNCLDELDVDNYKEWILKRRWKGIGGNVWYEDKNGKLKKEVK